MNYDHPLLFERNYLKGKKGYDPRLELYYRDPEMRVALWYIQARKTKLLKDLLGSMFYEQWRKYFGDGIVTVRDILLRAQLPEELKNVIPDFEKEQEIAEIVVKRPLTDPEHPLRFILKSDDMMYLALEEMASRLNDIISNIPKGKAADAYASIVIKMMEIVKEMKDKYDSTFDVLAEQALFDEAVEEDDEE